MMRALFLLEYVLPAAGLIATGVVGTLAVQRWIQRRERLAAIQASRQARQSLLVAASNDELLDEIAKRDFDGTSV